MVLLVVVVIGLSCSDSMYEAISVFVSVLRVKSYLLQLSSGAIQKRNRPILRYFLLQILKFNYSVSLTILKLPVILFP